MILKPCSINLQVNPASIVGRRQFKDVNTVAVCSKLFQSLSAPFQNLEVFQSSTVYPVNSDKECMYLQYNFENLKRPANVVKITCENWQQSLHWPLSSGHSLQQPSKVCSDSSVVNQLLLLSQEVSGKHTGLTVLQIQAIFLRISDCGRSLF